MSRASDIQGKVYVRGLSSIITMARQFGVSTGSLLCAAGIDKTLMSISDASIPLENYYQLLEHVVAKTEVPDIGLFIGRLNHLESMHLSLYMASSGRTLRDWLNMMPSIAELFGDVGVVNVKSTQEEFVLQWQPNTIPNPERCIITDGWISATVLQMDSFGLLPVKPTRVDLSYNRPADLSQLQAILGDNLYFNQPVSSVYYRRRVLDIPLAHVSTSLYDSVSKEFSQFSSEDSSVTDQFSSTLHSAILRQLPRGDCSIELIAKELNISRRTLQRRLKERESNFQQLLQRIKSKLAKKYLEDQRLSITEVAFLLGYGDHSTFSAAFKSWNGMTPSQFRQCSTVPFIRNSLTK